MQGRHKIGSSYLQEIGFTGRSQAHKAAKHVLGVPLLSRRKAALSNSLTPVELQIMQVLWRQGPSCVRDVQAELIPSLKFAYTTVQTILNVLQRKGKVERSLRGRAYEYRPILLYEEAFTQAVNDLVAGMCKGSWESFLTSLPSMHHARIKKAKIASKPSDGLHQSDRRQTEPR